MKIGVLEILKTDPHKLGLPNLLTLSRLLFIPVIAFFLAKNTPHGDRLALVFMFLSALTDYFDGFFARRLNQRSQLGRMLDPLVDKSSVAIIMFFLAAYKQLPYWYVGTVVARDILILAAGIYVIYKRKIVVESNMLGKWTLGTFILVILAYTINLGVFKEISLLLSCILIPLSTLKYLKMNQELLLKQRNQSSAKKSVMLESR